MVPIEEQRSRVLILVNSCIHIFYGITTIILATLAVKQTSSEQHVDNGIQRNWETPMITDILKTSSATCPNNYEPLFSFEWPGTKDACDCVLFDETPKKPHGPDGEYTQIANKNLNYKFHYNSQDMHERLTPQQEEQLDRLKSFGLENKLYPNDLCNWNQTKAGCRDLRGRKNVHMTNWKQHSLWCVSRAQAVSMFSMAKYYDFESGTCKDESLRVCGDPHDKSYQFCFPKAYPHCPINGISIMNHPPSGESAYHYNSAPIQFSRTMYLYISRNLPKRFPLAEFEISENLPCIENSASNISQDHKEYPLLKQQRHLCDSDHVDRRFSLLDQQGEQSFFFNNNMIHLRDSLPGFTLDNNYQYGLYQRSYIEWSHACAPDIELFLSGNLFESFQGKQDILKVITFVVSILAIFFATFELLLICRINFIMRIEKHVVFWSPCIQAALLLIVLPFCLAALRQSVMLAKAEQRISESKCTDETTIQLIGATTAHIREKVEVYNKEQIIFICLMLVINVIVFLISLFCSGPSGTQRKKKRRASTY